jgi:choline dehydrogenase-like flavoprotein
MTGEYQSFDTQADFKRRYDAVVIGTGAGGSSLAYRLGESGLHVLLVERGDFLKPQPRTATDPVGKFLYHVVKDRDEPLSFVGGQTKFYGSALFRLRESDFLEVEHESGVSPAWPISYPELEPYYGQAEAIYHVHGSPDGDPSEPCRSSPFPYPPIGHSPIVGEMVERLKSVGMNISAVPRGIDYGPQGRCILCATCDSYYCQLDAKMDAEIAAVRPALATGNVRLATRTECRRVLTDSEGARVKGVLLIGNGSEYVVHADIVAVCAGLPGSASLLRRSRTHAHPGGLGDASGSLGRYYGGHSVGYMFPFVSWRKLPPIHTKSFAVNSYYNGTPDWPYPTGVIQIAGQMPFWEGASRLMRPLAYVLGTRSLMCFYMTEARATRESGLIFDGDEIVSRVPPPTSIRSFAKLRDLGVTAFRNAGYPVLARRRPPYLWHEVGTARLGANPATSVVDPNCQVHGIKGLYVVDASVLPSAGAVNTGLTIIALALRAGDHIAGRSSDLTQASVEGRRDSYY